MRKLVIEESTHFFKCAILENGKLIFIDVIPKNKKQKLGDIYLGQVENVVSGLNAAFINIGETTGFLPIKNAEIKGQKFLVQIDKEGSTSKKPKLTRDITINGKYVILTPEDENIKIPKKHRDNENFLEISNQISKKFPGLGLILRSKSAQIDIDDILNDIAEAKAIFEKTIESEKVGLKHDSFNFDNYISDLIEKYFIESVITNNQEYFKKNKMLFFKNDITFKLAENLSFDYNNIDIHKFLNNQFEFNRGILIIEQTEALTIIDIDSGFVDNSRLNEEQKFQTNIAAIQKIIEILTLLDIGGIIVIDLINVEKKYIEKIEKFSQEAIKNHNKSIKVSKISRSGLMEITRQKSNQNIIEKLTEKCMCCNGSGKIESDEFVLDNFEMLLKLKVENVSKRTFDIDVPFFRYSRIKNHILGLGEKYNCIFQLIKSDVDINQIKIKTK